MRDADRSRPIAATRPPAPKQSAEVAAKAGYIASAGRHWVATLPRMHPLIEAHRAELLALARRRGVTGVRVFGSMSRCDDRDESDVDLLVTLAPGTSALALGGLLLDAQELLGRRVNVVTEASLHPALRERVMALACRCESRPRIGQGAAGAHARLPGPYLRVHQRRTLPLRRFASGSKTP